MSNPIIHRELIRVLRDRRAAVIQCGLAFAFLLLVAVRWPTDAHMALSGSRSQEVFQLFSFGLLGALLLLLPVYPASSIVRERQQGTLALLLNTPLGPVRIYFGKLLAMLGFSGLLLAVSLPAAAACHALGGVSLGRDVFGTYGILALTAVEVAAVGLLVSTFANTMDAAVRMTYGSLLAITVVSIVPHYFFLGAEPPMSEIVDWLRCFSPVAALMDRLGAGDVGTHGVLSKTDVVFRFVILSVLVSVVCSIWTISRLNHTLFDQVRSAGTIVNDQSLLVRVIRRVIFLVDPKRRSRAIGPFTNPVMVKEFRCRRFGRLHWLLRLVSACTVLSLALAILSATKSIAWDVTAIGALLVVLQVALLVLITPSLASGLISTERETKGWVMLQMTPMPIWRIVWGKLMSVFLTVALVMCATLPGYVVMVQIEPGLQFQIRRVVLCLCLTALFVILTSAAIGSLFRRTAQATVAAYVALLVVCVGPLLIWWGRDAPFGHDTVERALVINPIAAPLTVIRMPGFLDYELLPAHWWWLGSLSLISFCFLNWQTHRLSRPQ